MYENMFYKWMDDNPGAALLDYSWGDKNGPNALVVSESKEVSNEAIFEQYDNYYELLRIEEMESDNLQEKIIRYEIYSNNDAILDTDPPDINKTTIYGHTVLTITMYGMWMIFQVTITVNSPRGAIHILFRNNFSEL